MDTFLCSHFPITIGPSPLGGRGVFASRDLPAGTNILACSSAATFPTLTGPRCSNCFADAPSMRACTGCRVAAYCGPECQREDWPAHRGECGTKAAWVWSGDCSGSDAVTLHLLSRLIRGVSLRSSTAAAAAAATTKKSLPIYEHSWEDVVSMVGPTAKGHDDGATTHFSRIIHAALTAGFLAATPTIDTEALIRVALSFDVNDFAITDDLLATRASGVFPAGALLNHSNSPNCVTLFTTFDGAADALLMDQSPSHTTSTTTTAATASKTTVGPARFATLSPRILIMRTARSVVKGEELCHCYADLALPADDRASYLNATYGFTPPRTSLDDTSDAVILATKSDRKDLPPTLRVGIISPLSHGESVPPPTLETLESLPTCTVKTLKRALALAEAGGALGGHGAERDGGEEAARLGVTLDFWTSELLADDDARAAGGAALPRDEASRVALEEAALGASIEAFREFLSPLHVAVFGVAGAAIARHLLLGDSPAAAAACEHACAFYRAAYGPRCATHPMLSLQLLTLGDLYRSLAAAAQGGNTAGVARWRLTETRAATLRKRYVESGDIKSPTWNITHVVPVFRALRGAIINASEADSREATKAWLRDAEAAYTEAYNALCSTHGPRHALSEHAAIALEQVRINK